VPQDHYRVPVLQVINITDIDDKIIARAAEQNTTVLQCAQQLTRFIPEPPILPCSFGEND